MGTGSGSNWPSLARGTSCKSVIGKAFLRIDVLTGFGLLHSVGNGSGGRRCSRRLDSRLGDSGSGSGSGAGGCSFRRFSSASVTVFLPARCRERIGCPRRFRGTDSVVVSRGAGCKCKVTMHRRSCRRRSNRPTADGLPTLEARSGPGGPPEDDGAPMQVLTDRNTRTRVQGGSKQEQAWVTTRDRNSVTRGGLAVGGSGKGATGGGEIREI
jgi:hypothetical protein